MKPSEVMRTCAMRFLLWKAENNKNTQAHAAMGLNAVMEKIRASINGSYRAQ